MITQVILRSAFGYDTDIVSRETGLVCDPEEGLTQQQFKDETNINTIVQRFGLTGEIPGDFKAPVSGSFEGVYDFHTAMNAVRQAEEAFMELPGHMRARFNHDPQALIDFVEDGQNLDEARKLGLLQPKPEVTRDAVQAIDELRTTLTPKP